MTRYFIFLGTMFVASATISQVTIFEPGNISNNTVFGAAFTPDGRHVYFVNAFGGRDTLQLFQSTKENGKWGKPVPAFFGDSKYKQIDPAVSPDGKTILFNVNKNDDRNFDIYAVYRTDSGWTAPALLGDSINTMASEFYATISSNNNIYFTRRIESNDIYVSYFVNGRYLKAVPLDTVINTSKAESNPYISAGEDYLIFFSDRDGGFGNSDLYISFKKKNSWSIPINLGSNINTVDSEFCPTIDLSSGYFSFSRTKVTGQRRIENIYLVKLKDMKLKKLKKQAKYP